MSLRSKPLKVILYREILSLLMQAARRASRPRRSFIMADPEH